MTIARRDFVRDLLAASALPALGPAMGAIAGARPRGGSPQAALEADPDTVSFWNGFLQSTSQPAARVPTGRTRGGPTGMEREAFFFHYQQQEGLRPAMEIAPSDLVPEGDVSVSVNVSAFKPADEDQATFERLQSAQLRLDVVQDFPILSLFDTMAWTAVAVLMPTKTKKLPPLENLSFDPSTASQKMQNIVLPQGQGKWAVNLYAQKQDGFFTQLVHVITKEIGRFAPVFSLPAISTNALQSFNSFYGAIHSKPEYLFQSNPVPVFATQAALQGAASSRRLPLRSGTYVLVPYTQAQELAAKQADLELKQGLMVPKGTPSVQLYDAAKEALKTVTYATLDVTVKPTQLPCGKGK